MSEKEVKDFSSGGVCLVTPKNADRFAPFLLPNALSLIKAGEPVTALGYVAGATACGALCGFLKGSAFEIISLYVSPEYRKKRIGKKLVDTLCEGLGTFAKCVSLGLIISDEEHERLCAMLEAYGFLQEESDRQVFRTDLGRIASGRLFQREFGRDLLPSFSQMDRALLEKAQKQAKLKGLPLPEDGFFGASVDQKCSTICMKDEKLLAYIVVEKREEERLFVPGLANCTDTPMVLMKLLHDAVQKGLEYYSGDTPVFMQTLSGGGRKLLDTVECDPVRVDRRYTLHF